MTEWPFVEWAPTEEKKPSSKWKVSRDQQDEGSQATVNNMLKIIALSIRMIRRVIRTI